MTEETLRRDKTPWPADATAPAGTADGCEIVGSDMPQAKGGRGGTGDLGDGSKASDGSAEDHLQACEVTGSHHRPEDLVVFRGRRVSAAGKAILLQTLSAAQRHPSMLRRIVAALFDGVLLWVIDAVAFMFLMMFISPMLGLANATVAMVFGIGLVALHLVCIPVFYYAGFHAGGGQTPGKMFFGLKVVTMTGDTLGWRRSFVRALDPVVLLFAFAPLAVADQHALAWLFVVGYGVVNACCAAGSRYGRILHDRWAGSRLVLTRNDGQP